MRLITNSKTVINCQVTLPLSKSIINRLLVIRYLSGDESSLEPLSESMDVVIMQNLLQVIAGKSGNSETITELDTGNAGTVMRFLTAVLSVSTGNWLISGTERMQQRPVKPLTDALHSLGAELSFQKVPGYPPVFITGNPDLAGGTVKLDAGISSQFISALMMIGPMLKGGLTIELQGNIISGSYIKMTQSLMQMTGIDLGFKKNRLIISEGKYKNFNFSELVEPDWSSAAFWYQVASFAPRVDILLRGLHRQSAQGDSVLPEIYANLGVSSIFTTEGLRLTKAGILVTKELNYNFTDCPDLAQPVIVTCAALGVKGRFSGLKSLRIKETDRIAAMQNELIKLGFGLNVDGDEILLDGSKPYDTTAKSPVTIHCYDDHRMAMSFAPLALLRGDIFLDDPEVVKKSYPGFWEDMKRVGIGLI